ncbi:unnamed protein product [Darwinula stevensoni]|uniref:Zasp-like motif domain-containing protein n=1 Tax=Darwinula stevensoni TaxID=69355 RepID=A0A7R8X864_9CRUS|nr:unnamed protein product [Darwinula stevensoni]CAG0887752.1 unnamed protein product [Darwinula stevensoni]
MEQKKLKSTEFGGGQELHCGTPIPRPSTQPGNPAKDVVVKDREEGTHDPLDRPSVQSRCFLRDSTTTRRENGVLFRKAAKMTSIREKAGRVPTLVHRQFNSPLLMYSPEAVAETLDAHMKVLKTGAVGPPRITPLPFNESTYVCFPSIDFGELSAAPNLRKSEVLRALEEMDHRGRPGVWPPAAAGQQTEESTFYTTDQGKRVHWPPAEEEGVEEGSASPYQETPGLHQHSHQSHHPHYHYQQQQEPPPTMMPLRMVTPISQPSQPVHITFPTLKVQPKKWMRGDQKWPPKPAQPVDEEPPKETLRPLKQRKDYREFFEANKLPMNYPGYRAPPGTQYFGHETEYENYQTQYQSLHQGQTDM